MGRPLPPGASFVLPLRVPAPPRRTPPYVPPGTVPKVFIPPPPAAPIVLPAKRVR